MKLIKVEDEMLEPLLTLLVEGYMSPNSEVQVLCHQIAFQTGMHSNVKEVLDRGKPKLSE